MIKQNGDLSSQSEQESDFIFGDITPISSEHSWWSLGSIFDQKSSVDEMISRLDFAHFQLKMEPKVKTIRSDQMKSVLYHQK